VNLRRIVAAGPVPLRHVIAEYKHHARTVTCECGWHGSTESIHGERSPWQEHVLEHRPSRS
jgi:hypothetical protein